MEIKNLQEAITLSDELKELETAADIIKHDGSINIRSRTDAYSSIIRNVSLKKKIYEDILDRIDEIKQRIEEL